MYHYTDGGLRNVWLANGYEIKKTPFGDAVSFHDADGLTQAICQALTEKIGILTGVELRYIRSAGMGLSQPALGKLMGIDGQSIARWEKSGKVPRWADKLVRLLYSNKAQGNEPGVPATDRKRTDAAVAYRKWLEGKVSIARAGMADTEWAAERAEWEREAGGSHTFTLKYKLSTGDSDHAELVESLGAAGCDDALVGVGQPGRITLEFVRESENAEAALVSALADVKRAIPTAKLIELSPGSCFLRCRR